MFCSNCGTQIPDEASFCSKCGTPQIQGAQSAQTEEPKWETCEITYHDKNEFVSGAIFWFEADAIGPNGKYPAAKSKPVVCGSRFNNDPQSRNKKTVNAHEEIIKKLVSDGWQPTGARGYNWWNDRFTRQVRADWDAWEECEIKISFSNSKLFDSSRIFVAVATGRTEKTGEVKILAKSLPFKKLADLKIDQAKTKPDVLQVFHGFIEQLQKDGWESKNSCGEYWFQQQFRRKIK